MKRYLFFIIALCICLPIRADIHSPESLLDPANTALTQTEVKTTYTGTPAILIESPNKHNGTANRAEKIAPPDLPKSILKLPIKTPFGHDSTAPFIDHTTDFNILITVLDDKTIRVEEQIQFITTQEKSKFERTLSTRLTDIAGRAINTKIQPLSLQRDNIDFPFQKTETENTTTITYPRVLPKGIHRFTVKYLVSGAITNQHSLSDIFLSLTGFNWDQITERFSIVVFLPQKATFYTKELLFGSNNQPIPEGVSVKTDAAGNIMYQLTHPLPALADVRIHMILNKDALPSAVSDVITPPYLLKMMGGYIAILTLYILLSVLAARLKRWKKPLAASKRISPILWGQALNLSMTSSQINRIQEIGRPLRWLKWHNKTLLKIISFLRFNYEYIIGVLLLIFGLVKSSAISTALLRILALFNILPSQPTKGYQQILPIWFIFICFALGILAIGLISHYGTRAELKKLRNKLRHTLLDTPQGLNLAQRDIPTYYILATCLGFGKEWASHLTANNPNYKLSFLKEEKNQ